MKLSDKEKKLFKRIGRFFEEEVESRVKDGYRELESFLKKEIRLGKKGGGNGNKDLLDEIEVFLEEKVERRVREGYREVERFLKKDIRLGKDKKAKLFEYDPDSPFSYVAAFMRDRAVASVLPSTKFLIRRVLKAMDLGSARLVVEYGPAEGVITRQILDRVGRDAVLLAVERNENFVRALGRIADPRLSVVYGDVQDIDRILAERGLGPVDVAVSGIPFSFFNQRQRHQLLEKTLAMLRPRGRFVAYQFTTHLIPILQCYFRKVDTELELRNLPPHFVFTCHK